MVLRFLLRSRYRERIPVVVPRFQSSRCLLSCRYCRITNLVYLYANGGADSNRITLTINARNCIALRADYCIGVVVPPLGSPYLCIDVVIVNKIIVSRRLAFTAIKSTFLWVKCWTLTIHPNQGNVY